jgi:hypothetical protein
MKVTIAANAVDPITLHPLWLTRQTATRRAPRRTRCSQTSTAIERNYFNAQQKGRNTNVSTRFARQEK